MKSLKHYLYYFLLFIRKPFLLVANILVLLGIVMGLAGVTLIFSSTKQGLQGWVFAFIGFLFSFIIFIAKNYYDQWILKLNPHDTGLILH